MHLHHRHALEADHHLEGARVEEIADQHARRISPQRVRGLAPAPQAGFIDDVVMQEGCGMDEFHDRRQAHTGGIALGYRAGAPGQQHQQGAQPLATGADDVRPDLVDQHHIRGQPPANQPVHGSHVIAGQGLDARQVRDGQGRGARVHGVADGGGRRLYEPSTPLPYLPRRVNGKLPRKERDGAPRAIPTARCGIARQSGTGRRVYFVFGHPPPATT